MKGVWEGVQLAHGSCCCKPGVFNVVVEYVEGMLVKGVGGSQAGYHVKKGEMLNVEEGRSREGAGEEVEGRCRSFRVKALQLLKSEPSLD